MLVRLRGVHSLYDGDHELELPLNNGEWNTVKRISGVLPAEMGEAIAGGDTSLFVALAMIALARNGITAAEPILWAANPDTIDFGEDQPAAAVPPPLQNGESSQQPSDSRPRSGEDGKIGGADLQENGQSSTGGQTSETTAAYGSAISPR